MLADPLIPYFVVPALELGPIAIQPFGVLAALGIALAAWRMGREAARRGLDPRPLSDFAVWAVLAGVLAGHLMHLFLYHPEELRTGGPLQILMVWDGLSSTGGVLGGVVAALVFFRRRALRFGDYADALALGIAPGWAVARLGCFTVHDHPGVRTSFPLAVAFPDGARHDLGLYDALLLFAITAVVYALDRRGALRGRLLAIVAILYGGGRFLLDFLRATDVPYADARYFGLTPAQYVCVLLIAWGVFWLSSRRTAALRTRSPA